MNMLNRYIPFNLRVGLVLEFLVLLLAFWQCQGDTTAFFQHSARLSGRVSLFLFSVLLVYSTLHPRFERDEPVFHYKYLLFRDFAVIHIIHWFLLAAAVYLSGFELIPARLAGGVLAYALIVAMPIILLRTHWSEPVLMTLQAIYMLWVWFVFIMTYRARLAGESPTATGTTAEWLPLFYFTIGLFVWRIGFSYWHRFKQK